MEGSKTNFDRLARTMVINVQLHATSLTMKTLLQFA